MLCGSTQCFRLSGIEPFTEICPLYLCWLVTNWQLFTGATSATRGRGGAIGFSAAKFAVRGMAESMARELGPDGIHVAHVVIDGQIETPQVREAYSDRDSENFLDPDAIAASYWHLVEQDRSAWTLELDVRPHVEEF